MSTPPGYARRLDCTVLSCQKALVHRTVSLGDSFGSTLIASLSFGMDAGIQATQASAYQTNKYKLIVSDDRGECCVSKFRPVGPIELFRSCACQSISLEQEKERRFGNEKANGTQMRIVVQVLERTSHGLVSRVGNVFLAPNNTWVTLLLHAPGNHKFPRKLQHFSSPKPTRTKIEFV